MKLIDVKNNTYNDFDEKVIKKIHCKKYIV